MSQDKRKIELVSFYVEKANNSLADAKLLAENNRWNGCANRLYYACFFMVYAILLDKIDVRIKSHSGIKTLFNQHFIKTGIIEMVHSKHYTYLFDLRGDADYGDFEIITKEEIAPLVVGTEMFINNLKEFISKA